MLSIENLMSFVDSVDDNLSIFFIFVNGMNFSEYQHTFSNETEFLYEKKFSKVEDKFW